MGNAIIWMDGIKEALENAENYILIVKKKNNPANTSDPNLICMSSLINNEGIAETKEDAVHFCYETAAYSNLIQEKNPQFFK